MQRARKKVAVIGAGVAGITSAWRLSSDYDVSLFEQSDYLGGHTSTVVIEKGKDEGLAVDTGFIVLNDRTYPLFTALLNELGAAIRYADMSFSVFVERSNLQYCSRDLSVLFAQRSNLGSARFLKMLWDLQRFWRVAAAELERDSLGEITLLDFLNAHSFSAALREDFLYPLAGAVWSSSDKQLEKFPAQTFLTFFRNHGWLGYHDQPRWQTVRGGSFQYVKRFHSKFSGHIYLNANVVGVRRVSTLHEVELGNGRRELFDLVIIATHADSVLKILRDSTENEQRVFSSWRYSTNRTLLHTDSGCMPPLRRAWGSWNYRKELGEEGDEPVSVNYHMNRLQDLASDIQYFVTLNPRTDPRADSVIREFSYTHPIYTPSSVAAQTDLRHWNGEQGRWYCGSYCGYGFHEDAVRSAEEISRKILMSQPSKEGISI